MENIKKPEMILSITTTASLIAACYLFYKKVQGIESRITDIESNLPNLFEKAKMTDLHAKYFTQLTEAMNKVGSDVKSHKNTIEEIKSLIEYQQEVLEIMVDEFQKMTGEEIRIPKPPYSAREWDERYMNHTSLKSRRPVQNRVIDKEDEYEDEREDRNKSRRPSKNNQRNKNRRRSYDETENKIPDSRNSQRGLNTGVSSREFDHYGRGGSSRNENEDSDYEQQESDDDDDMGRNNRKKGGRSERRSNDNRYAELGL